MSFPVLSIDVICCLFLVEGSEEAAEDLHIEALADTGSEPVSASYALHILRHSLTLSASFSLPF